jgi:hypothetical protein
LTVFLGLLANLGANILEIVTTDIARFSNVVSCRADTSRGSFVLNVITAFL